MIGDKPSKRAAYREATRRKVLSTARSMVMKRGVEDLSMDEIAQSCDLSRATVYQHFSGVHAVFVALLAEDWLGRERLFAQLNAGSPAATAALSKWLKRVVEGARRAKGSFEMHRAALVHDNIGGGLHKAHRDRLVRLLFQQLRGDEADQEHLELRVEAAMIVAEIEYVATAAVTEWRAAEVAIAVARTAARMLEFSKSR